MPEKYGLMVRQLGQINIQLRHLMEKAEAKVTRVNSLVRKLAKTGLLKKMTILGKQSRCVSYTDDERPNSCRVVLPVLLTPEGFGVCIWDADQALEIKETGMLKSKARRTFMPFAKCEPADKGYLMTFIEPLLEDLLDVASVASGDLVQRAEVSAREYFETRKKKH